MRAQLLVVNHSATFRMRCGLGNLERALFVTFPINHALRLYFHTTWGGSTLLAQSQVSNSVNAVQ